MPKVEKLKQLEDKLWERATELWGTIDVTKYKVLFYRFFRYISDVFEKKELKK